MMEPWNEPKRVLMHLPVGFASMLLAILNPILVLTAFAAFWFYEQNEDWHLKDGAFKDTYGWLVGFFLASPLVWWLSSTSL